MQGQTRTVPGTAKADFLVQAAAVQLILCKTAHFRVNRKHISFCVSLYDRKQCAALILCHELPCHEILFFQSGQTVIQAFVCELVIFMHRSNLLFYHLFFFL